MARGSKTGKPAVRTWFGRRKRELPPSAAPSERASDPQREMAARRNHGRGIERIDSGAQIGQAGVRALAKRATHRTAPRSNAASPPRGCPGEGPNVGTEDFQGGNGGETVP